MTCGQQSFFGGGGTASLPPTITILRDVGSPAEFYLNVDGRIQARQGTGTVVTDIGTWLAGGGAGGGWEVQSVVLTGSFTSDPSAGSFINLNTTRTWTRAAGVGTSQVVTATINIRPVGGSIVTTSTLSLQDDNNP